jgi:outer membrane protein OmpA-like peptidoglycan-associated protein
MATIRIKARELAKRPIGVPTGERTTVIVEMLSAFRLEMEGVHFHFDSAVLLPDRRTDANEDVAADPITGIAVLRAALEHARDNRSQKLYITGHTDTTGAKSYNLSLSSLRAKGVAHALLGERDEWARVARAKNVVLDQQVILHWIAEEFGWDCDPGALDGVSGPETRAAVTSFQRRYDDEFKANVTVDGRVGNETWCAFFDLYERGLRKLLKVGAAGLAPLRSALKFVDDSNRFVGCGESHPIEAADRDEFRSATNRRVELLFFETGQEPQVPCHPNATLCKPGLCELYALGVYDFEPLEPAPHERGTVRIFLLDADHRLMKGAPYRLTVRRLVRTGNSDDSGLVTEPKLPLSRSCWLEWGKGANEGEFLFQTQLELHVTPDSTPHFDPIEAA